MPEVKDVILKDFKSLSESNLNSLLNKTWVEVNAETTYNIRSWGVEFQKSLDSVYDGSTFWQALPKNFEKSGFSRHLTLAGEPHLPNVSVNPSNFNEKEALLLHNYLSILKYVSIQADEEATTVVSKYSINWLLKSIERSYPVFDMSLKEKKGGSKLYPIGQLEMSSLNKRPPLNDEQSWFAGGEVITPYEMKDVFYRHFDYLARARCWLEKHSDELSEKFGKAYDTDLIPDVKTLYDVLKTNVLPQLTAFIDKYAEILENIVCPIYVTPDYIKFAVSLNQNGFKTLSLFENDIQYKLFLKSTTTPATCMELYQSVTFGQTTPSYLSSYEPASMSPVSVSVRIPQEEITLSKPWELSIAADNIEAMVADIEDMLAADTEAAVADNTEAVVVGQPNEVWLPQPNEVWLPPLRRPNFAEVVLPDLHERGTPPNPAPWGGVPVSVLIFAAACLVVSSVLSVAYWGLFKAWAANIINQITTNFYLSVAERSRGPSNRSSLLEQYISNSKKPYGTSADADLMVQELWLDRPMSDLYFFITSDTFCAVVCKSIAFGMFFALPFWYFSIRKRTSCLQEKNRQTQ